MIKILFVCHGNICRSTMSQSVFQHMVDQAGLSDEFYIDSAATSREEIGNPPHHGTQRKLRQAGIPCVHHRARQMRKDEYDQFDYIIGMDTWNIRNINRIIGNGDPENFWILRTGEERISRTPGTQGILTRHTEM